MSAHPTSAGGEGAAQAGGVETAAAPPRIGLMVVGAGEAAARCRAALLAAGRPVTAVRAADDAARRAADAPGPLVVALELQSIGYDGLAALANLRAASPKALVVVLARQGALNRARAAMEAGAFDYLVHPAEDALTVAVVAGAEEAAARPFDAAQEARLIKAAPSLAGSSAVASACRARAARLARASAPLLVTGERGVGKARVSTALHLLSRRPARPMEQVRCARRDIDALAADLEAALHRWTGGAAPEEGRADPLAGATLLLEMTCTLPTGLQSRVLRLLDAAAAGGRAADGAARLRLICSARDDLEQRVADGQFRENLFQRLGVARLDLPPLRDRGDDAPELAERRLAEIAPGFRGLHPETRRALRDHPWPYNFAQLTRTVDAMARRLDDGWATPAGLSDEFLTTRLRPRAGRPRPADASAPSRPRGAPTAEAQASPTGLAAQVVPLVGLTLAQVEAALTEATLIRCGGSVAEAARMLGISPATLYRRRSAAAQTEAQSRKPADGPAPSRHAEALPDLHADAAAMADPSARQDP